MKKHKNGAVFILMILAMLIILPETVCANGWIDKRNTGIYSNNSTHRIEESEEENEPNMVEKYLSEFIANLGDNLISLLKEGEVDLSIDGVVLGRMASGVDVSYVQFELSDGNPWGVIGSLVYRALVTIAVGLFFLWFIANLCGYQIKSDQKGRAECKTFIMHAVFYFILMFMLHYLIDYLLYFKDVLLYVLSQNLPSELGVDTGGASSIVETFKIRLTSDGGFFNGFLFLGSVFSGVFFITNYVGTAMLQMGLFGSLPYCCLASTKGKKLMSVWTSTFIPNVFVPIVDYVLLLVPNGIYAIVCSYVSEEAAKSFGICLIQLFCIWSIIPTRNAIFRVLASQMGVSVPANGIRGLASMAMLAARRIGRGGSLTQGGSAEENQSIDSDAKKASESREQAERFDEINRRTSSGMSDIDNLLGKDTISHDETSFGNSDTMPNLKTDEFLDSYDGETSTDSDGLGDDSLSDVDTQGFDTQGADVDETSLGALDTPDGLTGNMPDALTETLETDSLGDNIMNNSEDWITADDSVDTALDVEPAANSVYASSEAISSDIEQGIGSESRNTLENEATSVNSELSEHIQDNTNDFDTYSNIPNMDTEFAQSLGGSDRDRYANLSARDALREEVASNAAEMSDINERMIAGNNAYENLQTENAALSNSIEKNKATYDGYKNEYEGLQHQNMDIDKEMQSIMSGSGSYIGQTASGINEMSQPAQQRLGELSALKQRNELRMSELQSGMNDAEMNISAANESISNNNAQMGDIRREQQGYREKTAKLQSRNLALQNGIENCSNRERQYASNYGAAGMVDKTYNSADSFKISKMEQKNALKYADYKNFDKGNFEQYLSPEQRGQYYHERAMNAHKDAAAKMLRAAPKVAGAVAVGTIVASAATYGGPDAMAMAAVGGVETSKKLGDAIGRGVSNVAAYASEYKAVPNEKKVAVRPSAERKRNVKQDRKVTTSSNIEQKLQEQFNRDKRENDRRYEAYRNEHAMSENSDREKMQEQFNRDKRENDRRYEAYRNEHEMDQK